MKISHKSLVEVEITATISSNSPAIITITEKITRRKIREITDRKRLGKTLRKITAMRPIRKADKNNLFIGSITRNFVSSDLNLVHEIITKKNIIRLTNSMIYGERRNSPLNLTL